MPEYERTNIYTHLFNYIEIRKSWSSLDYTGITAEQE